MEPDFIGGEEADRYRDALRALEAASGRVVARLEITWSRREDASGKRFAKAELNAVASTREEERALVEIGFLILKGGDRYHVETPAEQGTGESINPPENSASEDV